MSWVEEAGEEAGGICGSSLCAGSSDPTIFSSGFSVVVFGVDFGSELGIPGITREGSSALGSGTGSGCGSGSLSSLE